MLPNPGGARPNGKVRKCEPGVRTGASNNQRIVRIDGLIRSDVFNPPPPICPEEIKPQTILIRIDFLHQLIAEKGPLRRVNGAFENGVLHPLPIVLANLCDTPQPGLPSRVDCGNVVAYDNHHGRSLFPYKWRVCIQLTSERPAKQERLDEKEHSHVHFFSKEGMHDFFLFSVLVSDEHLLSCFIAH